MYCDLFKSFFNEKYDDLLCIIQGTYTSDLDYDSIPPNWQTLCSSIPIRYLLKQLLIRDMPHHIRHRTVVNDRHAAAVPGCDVPVHRIVARIQVATGEPLGARRLAVVQDGGERYIPVDQPIRQFAPELFRLGQRSTVHLGVVVIVVIGGAVAVADALCELYLNW